MLMLQGVPTAAIADVPMPEAIASEWQRAWGASMPTRSHQNPHLPGLHGSSSAPLPSTPTFDPAQQPLQLPLGLPQPHDPYHRLAHLQAQTNPQSSEVSGAEWAQAEGGSGLGDAATRHARPGVQGVVPQELEQQLQNEHPLEALPAAPPGEATASHKQPPTPPRFSCYTLMHALANFTAAQSYW